MKRKSFAVIGGGAAGLLAAGMAAESGLLVTVFEPNEKLGRKLRITGKGRCNITNACDMAGFLEHIPCGGCFLCSSFSNFSSYDVIDFFENLGVRLKIERGNRVFPQSDQANEVAQALIDYCKRGGVSFKREKVLDILFDGDKAVGLVTKDGEFFFDSILLATGGKSYPATGSTGDGYRFAKKTGHTVSPLRQSLVPLVTKEKWPALAQGVSLRNVRITVIDEKRKKQVCSEQGEALFTHYGVSGPLVLQASALMDDMEPERYRLTFDLKPALSEEKLDKRILRELEEAGAKTAGNIMKALLPNKLIVPICNLSEIPIGLLGSRITKRQRKNLVKVLKNLSLTTEGFRPWEEAIITRGGVCLKEVNPKTMESVLKKGLYFAGEILDVDGYTGGFNLQIAWSTAAAVAKAVCRENIN